MRSGVYLSIGFALLLVGCAFWIRYAEERPSGTLSLVNTPDITGPSYDFLKTDSVASTTGSVSTAPLSNTDVISRKLFSDYVALSSQGQVTNESLATLANKYVEVIPTLAVSNQFDYGDIKNVVNSKANLQAYSETITKIYTAYGQALLKIQGGGEITAVFLTGTGETPSKMRDLYQNTAYNLVNMTVPAAVAVNHLALANLYLENASAMDYLVKSQTDPANAFSGLLMLKQNVSREADLLTKIQQTLTSNGI